MAQGFQQLKDHRLKRNSRFLQLAESLTPELQQTTIRPRAIVRLHKDDRHPHGWFAEDIATPDSLDAQRLNTGDEVILDLGTHCVGYLHLSCEVMGSPQDAPVHLQFIFGEITPEVAEDFADYSGWLSSSWLQQEHRYIDVLPENIQLARRYCCRYVKIRVVATSQKFGIRLSDIAFTCVSSAQTLPALTRFSDPLLQKIDDISVLTLKNCMQSVFEDGPKRDRRLWLGDLRLQALVNYHTFQQDSLVRRCLYLFAGVTREDGMVAANLFMQPEVIADDTYLLDYSLFFVATLADYFAHSGDRETVEDLWPTAWRQIELALERLDADDLLQDSEQWWAFIDWHEQLNKQAPAQGVFIYCLQKALILAEAVAPASVAVIEQLLRRLKDASMQHLWQPEMGFFASGKDKQISWASQVWMILAGVGDETFQLALLNRLSSDAPAIALQTPYMMHHYVEALIQCGQHAGAEQVIKAYWGEMVNRGADTFWEVFNAEDATLSPYGSHLINSYCHAWSCTPAWLLRQK
ncbi:sugar hydrolase [Pantoea sp. DY-5]|uniref:alpha-L-rhamnosidase-related protein n=1 Tax=Pantoea sp. DY-5 TaxID=2871488 RepID=UPI001C96E0B2|nr:sugar hydrolase [Pantoea sp. DY-5]MBY4837051.1 sugar hydrolase [Pantoea sp. DY-5]